MVDLTPMTVLALHHMAMEASGAHPQAVRDHGALESALARPHFLRAYGKNDPVELSAAVAAALVQHYAFVDGNKRTAWQVLTWLIRANGLDLRLPPPEECAAMLSGLAAHELTELEFLHWVRRAVALEERPDPQ